MNKTNSGNRFMVLITLIVLAALAAPAQAQVVDLFHKSDQCIACHTQLTAPSGEDVSIGFNWRSSMMGNSARDPYWMAGVRREALDHPAAVAAIEDKCTVCHLPIARTLAVSHGMPATAFEHFPYLGKGGPLTELGRDGVSCTVCHQILDENLGTRDGFTGGYVIDLRTPMGERTVYGPFEVDEGRTRIMQSASQFTPQMASHIQSAQFCANCHTLFTHALDPDGNEVSELPEQTPYLEWLHSDYPGQQTCQDCHMPVIEGEVAVSGVLPNPRTDVNQHVFKGGNFLIPRVLNKHRARMDVQALPQELDATARASEENLANNSALLHMEQLSSEEGRLEVGVTVTNLVGHKLPSAYPSRRVWLHVKVLDRSGRTLFESGAFEADGSINGNDNDQDGSRFEPHYDRITSADQVQIYEDIMVDYADNVTTGLLYGARYIKDNRLLPTGFDKSTASSDVAVHGAAEGDADFVGGSDRVTYAVSLGSGRAPYTVVAELWYQPIGYRWAMNLGEYDTAESDQFMGFFNEVAPASGTVLASTEVVLR